MDGLQIEGEKQLSPDLAATARVGRTPRDRWYRTAIGVMTMVLALFSPAAFVVLGWFTEAYQDTSASSEVSHRLHEVVFGILFSIALVGAASQWRNPRQNLAGLLQLTVSLGVLALVVATTVGWDPGLLLYVVPLGLVLALHPGAAPTRSGPIWWWALFLTLVAVPGITGDVAGHAERAQAAAQNHTTHWSAMAAFAAVLICLGVVVAFRVTGHRLVAATLGISAIGYGIAALLFPYDASSHRPEYSIGMILWGLAWLLSVRFLDRTSRAARSRLIRIASGAAIVLFALMVGRVWAEFDTPPNVPHRPSPDEPMMTAGGVDRATCLQCHATGVAGAPIVPHDLGRACEEQPCWGGRTDCVGCHRIDPGLGGPREQIQVGVWPQLAVDKPPESSERLTRQEINLIRQLEVGR